MLRILNKIFSILYMLVFVLAGLMVLLFSWGIVPVELCSDFLGKMSFDVLHQSIGSFIALFFILTGFLVPINVSRKLRNKRVVAFKNPDGEVTISLSAIEEYIKRVATNISEIENVRSKVAMGKRGININSDVTITSGANIPEITEIIQSQVRQRLQNMLGVEERINVKMHVRKIGKSPADEDSEARQVPYRELD